MKIIAKDFVESSKINPLEITDKKKAEMLAKAIGILDGKSMEEKDIRDSLEQFYTDKNEHYTRSQLKTVTQALYEDINKCEDCGKYPCECVKEEKINLA